MTWGEFFLFVSLWVASGVLAVYLSGLSDRLRKAPPNKDIELIVPLGGIALFIILGILAGVLTRNLYKLGRGGGDDSNSRNSSISRCTRR